MNSKELIDLLPFYPQLQLHRFALKLYCGLQREALRASIKIYTQTTSRIGSLARSGLAFEASEAVDEAAQFK